MNESIHVGVNQVDTTQYGSTLPKLFGPPWDIEAMSGIAKNVAGVLKPKPLLNEQAKADDVLKALADAAKRVTQGLVIISFAGHGYPTQGGSVQGWCLFDRVLTEREIKQALRAFGKGVRVVVVADCCYAMPEEGLLGAVRRWLGRGKRSTPSVVRCVPRKSLRAVLKSPAAPKRLFGAVAGSSDYKCAVMWFASCGHNQKAYDGKDGSAFSHVLGDSFAHGETWSYTQLCDKVRESVNSAQTPECALITSGITGGEWGTSSPAFR
ncbi:unannotated protein [freshwater metagenome]|uniref:Unannotated protein n=1 Tax=freshwater metagenome TaxID=449393 RepID=A0A6J7L9M4_9ZZZZ